MTFLDVLKSWESSDDFADAAESDSDFDGFYDHERKSLGFTRRCLDCHCEVNSRVPRCRGCWRVNFRSITNSSKK